MAKNNSPSVTEELDRTGDGIEIARKTALVLEMCLHEIALLSRPDGVFKFLGLGLNLIF
jgi:hypothetical protein